MNAAEHYIIYIVCIQNIQFYTLALLLLWYKQRTFFDVKVFNPFAKSYRDIPLTKCYKRREQQKKRTYKERIHKVKHGPFTPLIFSTQGGMSKETTTMCKRLASLLPSKGSEPYSRTINWIRCRIGFALLWSTIMCLKEARSSHLHFIRNSTKNCDSPVDLAISEERIQTITAILFYLQP